MIAINDNTERTLLDYFNKVYWPRKLTGSPRTAVLYRLTFARFKDFLGHPPTLADLNDESVCGFLQDRLGQGLAQHTVDKERDKLLALATFAAKKRAIPEFLDVPAIKPASITPQCWRREHLAMLLKACEETKGLIGKCPARYWWLALNYLILYTGERTGAVLELRWEWLDGRVLRVPASVRKGRKKPMVYFLPATVVSALERLRGYTEGLIFQTPWARGHASGTFYRHYTKLLERAGLPTGRKFKPQQLRRTFASYLEAAGGDATAALAHSDSKVTKESYLDPGVTQAGRESAGETVERTLRLFA